MNTKKLLIFQVLSLIVGLFTFYLYNRSGFYFSAEYLGSNIIQILILFALIVSNMLVSYSYSSKIATYKKNYLRVSLLLIFLSTLYFLMLRVLEVINLYFNVLGFVHLFFYIGLIVMNVVILRDLYQIIVKHRFKNK